MGHPSSSPNKGPGATGKGVGRMYKGRGKGIRAANMTGVVRAQTKAQVMMRRRFEAKLAGLAWQNAELSVSGRKAETDARELLRLVVAAVMQTGATVRDPASGRAVSWELDLSGAVPSDDVLIRAQLNVTADYHIKLEFREAEKDG